MWSKWFRRSSRANVVKWAYDSNRHSNMNGFALFAYPPEPVIAHYYSKNGSQFMKCPAFKSALQNTYVLRSPADIEIHYNRSGEPKRMNVVKPDKATPALKSYLINPRFRETRGDGAHEIFSLMTIPYLFWSESSITLELVAPYLEWDNPNEVRVISGHYNIGKWMRHIEYAAELRRRDGVFKLNRGDVMAYVRFASQYDPHVKVVMEEHEITRAMRIDIQQNTNSKFAMSHCPLNKLYELRKAFTERNVHHD